MFSKRMVAAILPLLAGVGAAGLAMGAGDGGPDAGPLRCEIHAASAGGMVALSGLVRADSAVSGSYRFRVAGSGRSGNSNVEQGGAFVANPAGPATLGTVMLGSGGDYEASLEVTANGVTVTCSKRSEAI